MIEYKIIKESRFWPIGNVEKAIEQRINELAKDGWRLVSLSYSNLNSAHAALERDASNNNVLG